MSLPVFLAILNYAALSVPLTIIDLREHRLPNRFTISALILTITLVSLDAAPDRIGQLAVGLLSGLATWVTGYLLADRDGIGMGDVKLLTGMHVLLGYANPLLILVSLTFSSTLASIASGVMLLGKKATLKSRAAFGPYLFAGFFAALLLGATVAA
jgi:leader peptidase (prepilin peptidase)/N-methyltransferase